MARRSRKHPKRRKKKREAQPVSRSAETGRSEAESPPPPRERHPPPRRRTPPLRRPLWSFLVFFVIGFGLAAAVSLTIRAGGGSGASKPSTTATAPEREIDWKARTAAGKHFKKGQEYYVEERLAEAYREFEEASRVDPTMPEPYVGMAEICKKLDYAQRAEQSYRRALQIDREYHGALVGLARLLCDFGKNEESLGLIKDADQRDSWVLALFAVNLLRLGRPEEALTYLRRYVALEENDAWGFEHLGRASAESGDLEAAEPAYRRALALDPATELGHLWLGQLLIRTERKDEAQPILKRFRYLRDLQTTKRELEHAIARRPPDPRRHIMLLVRLAKVRFLIGKEERAQIPLRKAEQLATGDEELRAFFTELLREIGIGRGGGKAPK